LLVEVDAKGNLASLFEHERVGYTPKQVQPGVWAMAMNTEASLREYLKLNLRIPIAGRIGPVARVFDRRDGSYARTARKHGDLLDAGLDLHGIAHTTRRVGLTRAYCQAGVERARRLDYRLSRLPSSFHDSETGSRAA